MMKFVYSSLLALTLLFPMTACGSNSEASISVPAIFTMTIEQVTDEGGGDL